MSLTSHVLVLLWILKGRPYLCFMPEQNLVRTYIQGNDKENLYNGQNLSDLRLPNILRVQCFLIRKLHSNFDAYFCVTFYVPSVCKRVQLLVAQ